MSIWGIIFLTATTLMMIELLVHVIIFAKTGRGGFDEAPFAIYGELIREAKARNQVKKEIPSENARDGVYPAA